MEKNSGSEWAGLNRVALCILQVHSLASTPVFSSYRLLTRTSQKTLYLDPFKTHSLRPKSHERDLIKSFYGRNSLRKSGDVSSCLTIICLTSSLRWGTNTSPITPAAARIGFMWPMLPWAAFFVKFCVCSSEGVLTPLWL